MGEQLAMLHAVPVAAPLRGAVLSPCGAYRYRLWRVWDAGLPRVLWVMLNPSTADADADDPTIRKCVGFARRWGCGGIEVVNLWAYRATDPKALARAGWPVGPDNDAHVREAASRAGEIICAWGANVPPNSPRVDAVERMLGPQGRARCLGYTADDEPRHPLMLAYATEREPWLSNVDPDERPAGAGGGA